MQRFPYQKKIKSGFKKPTTLELREPITLDLLAKLVAALKPVCASNYEQTIFKCAYLLAFYGIFRIGEFVADTKDRALKSVLLPSDTVVKNGCLKVTIRLSKTDQNGLSNGITFNGHKGNPLCPVEATKDFLAIRGPRAGPIFMHFNGTFLSRFQFNSILASTLKFADAKHIMNPP